MAASIKIVEGAPNLCGACKQRENFIEHVMVLSSFKEEFHLTEVRDALRRLLSVLAVAAATRSETHWLLEKLTLYDCMSANVLIFQKVSMTAG